MRWLWYIAQALFIGGLSATSTAVNAQFADGNKLFDSCKVKQPAGMTYILGVYDATVMFDWVDQTKVFKICTRPNVTGNQMYDIVCQYLEHNPATRDAPATTAILNALQRAFPCQKTSR